MELGTVILGAAIGGAVGLLSGRRGEPLKYALWGGGAGLAAGLLGLGRGIGGFKVGQLPFSLPEPGLPGQLVYSVDPRRDPLLDPVSRERLYPDWLLLHWQHGDPKIVAQVQQMLGVAADGAIGGGTLGALRAFQAHIGLPPTAVMDHATMVALISG